MPAQQYRKKPLPITALKWEGDNLDEMLEFVVQHGDGDMFQVLDPETGWAHVWDYLHDSWVDLEVGDMVARGVKDECYPIKADVFAMTYDAPGESSIDAAGKVNEELKQKIDELEAKVAGLTAVGEAANREISHARELHHQDIVQISRVLMQQAYAEDWCSQYDDVVEDLNKTLTFPLLDRRKAHILKYSIDVVSFELDREAAQEECENRLRGMWDRDTSLLDYGFERVTHAPRRS